MNREGWSSLRALGAALNRAQPRGRAGVSSVAPSALCALFALAGCAKDDTAKAPVARPPAKVVPAAGEGAPAVVTLTAEAEARLGIETEVTQVRSMQRTRTRGGEVVLPPGHRLAVRAPLPGTLNVPAGGPPPRAGDVVEVGQIVMELLPLLSPERDLLTPLQQVELSATRSNFELDRAAAEGELGLARVRVDAAKVALDRAQTLLEGEAGSARARDEASAELRLAQAELRTARQRKDLFAPFAGDESAQERQPLAVRSPLAGAIVGLHAAPGQTVESGAALFDVADLRTVWIRVPVFVGEMESFAADAGALVHPYGSGDERAALHARAAAAPPSADPLTSTADLWFELEQADGSLRPGQRVVATLELRGAEQAIAIPVSSVVYDHFGSAWVYENTAPQIFLRRRVELQPGAGGYAVVSRGLEPGVKVVTAGVAELFGTEFGIGK